MALLPGSRVGSYEVLELLGTGGMGEVYKARDVRLRRTVALKTLGAWVENNPQARARFTREARAIAALNHPNICNIHDVGEWDGQHFLVIEFVDGETLQHRLARGPLPVEDLLRIGIQIASALVAAHRAGIVHGDLKPANVMLTRDGSVKLLDFGIARHSPPSESLATDATLTETALGADDEFAGTLPYMAPEQLEGRPTDGRTDIFAFGAVLLEMASGRRAFEGGSAPATIAAILGDVRPRLGSADPKVPRALDRLVSTCLARNPDDRWQHSADLFRELTWVRDDLGRQDDAVGPSRPRRWVVHALWALTLVAAAGLSWFAASGANGTTTDANSTPVVVLMDSPLPGRVYDARTAAAGGTNADDVTDAIRELPVVVHKENTSASWHREEQVVAQNPDLVVAHLSSLFDVRVTGDLPSVHDHLFAQAEHRLLLFLAYAAARNPRTRFIIYSRTVFQASGGEDQWVAQQEARLPVLKDRLQAFIVPGGPDRATFRDPQTASMLRARIAAVLELPSGDQGR